MKRERPLFATASVSVLFLTGLLAGSATGAMAVSRAQDPYTGLDVFARVLTVIEQSYVEEVPSEVLIDAAIRGMVDELDPHTRWLSAEQTTALRDETDGLAHGIGVKVERSDDGHLLVTDVLVGSPAFRDGISAGDTILAIDGEDVTDAEVEQHLRGPRGEETTLTILRDGWEEPVAVQTVHDVIPHTYVEVAALGSGVVYARVEQFPHGVARELESALSELSATEPMTGLILDLRDNPGGLLDEAVAVTDLFLDDGPIVSTRGRTTEAQVHQATPGGLPQDVDVVVLVNGMSASAAEIVASALQEASRAQLVGTHTYGKGSVQTVYRNPDGSALKLTVSMYYTRSGQPVAAESGRTPDVVVELQPTGGPRATLRRRLSSLELDEGERGELLALVDALPSDPQVRAQVRWDLSPLQRAAIDAQLQRAQKLLTP